MEETKDTPCTALAKDISTLVINSSPMNESTGSEGNTASRSIPEVFTATWLHEDHIIELTRILHGVEADRVEGCLVQYVEENIEPAGWKAVWQYSQPSVTESQSQPHVVKNQEAFQTLYEQHVSPGPTQRFVVEVVNVSREKLEAEVKYCNITHKDLVKSCPDDQFTVPLVQLYPLAVQENEAIDIATTAEVVEQVRFFYNHIWQAWDLEEESCCYDQHLIARRLQLYQDIETGRIPSSVGSELRQLVKIANVVQKEIEATEKLGGEDEVDEEKVSILIHLHKTLENLKARFDLIQEPVLRELSTSSQPIDCSWAVASQRTNLAKILIVVDCLSLDALTDISCLPEILKKLPQVPEDALCQSYPSLQLALNAARKDDVIVLLPGIHLLQYIGLISGGGTLLGVGTDVIIEGTKNSGDVLIDITGDFSLQNVTLKPLPNQIGIVHHKGNLILNKVEIQGGVTGMIGLGKTHTKIESSTVRDSTQKGVDFRESAFADLSQTSFVGCGVGIQVEEDSKVSVSYCKIESSAEYGILVMWPEGSDISSFKDIPKEALMKSLLAEYSGNILSNNKEDAGVTVATRPPVEDQLSRSFEEDFVPHNSTGSLDSGFEYIESESK
ncbi:protein nessun dorma [Macrobrachium rosenbergii]|uniref:protein nessun dorma n=1 Tax=Macrobrachium rosenbergii TaxID=79674 RepID=UPI0034D3C020